MTDVAGGSRGTSGGILARQCAGVAHRHSTLVEASCCQPLPLLGDTKVLVKVFFQRVKWNCSKGWLAQVRKCLAHPTRANPCPSQVAEVGIQRGSSSEEFQAPACNVHEPLSLSLFLVVSLSFFFSVCLFCVLLPSILPSCRPSVPASFLDFLHSFLSLFVPLLSLLLLSPLSSLLSLSLLSSLLSLLVEQLRLSTR